jgi:fatty acid synthase
VLKPKGYDIYKIITDKDSKIFDEIVHSFIGIAAIQVILDLLTGIIKSTI